MLAREKFIPGQSANGARTDALIVAPILPRDPVKDDNFG